jgi:hypothetical protein
LIKIPFNRSVGENKFQSTSIYEFQSFSDDYGYNNWNDLLTLTFENGKWTASIEKINDEWR